LRGLVGELDPQNSASAIGWLPGGAVFSILLSFFPADRGFEGAMSQHCDVIVNEELCVAWYVEQPPKRAVAFTATQMRWV
jgi:hypothetical protein